MQMHISSPSERAAGAGGLPSRLRDRPTIL